MRAKAYFLSATILLSLSLPVYGEEAAGGPANVESLKGITYEHREVEAAPRSHERMTRDAIRQRVIALRGDRFQRMPYLDRGFIKSTIRPEKVQEKIQFVEGGPKKLQDLIDRAVDVHTPAKAAQERISLAYRRIVVALRNLFPAAKFQYKDTEGLLSQDPFNSRSFRFTLTQPVFRGGILWNTMRQERAGLKEAEKQYDKIVADLIRDLSKAYFEYTRSLEVSEDQAQALEEMKQYVQISEQKFKAEIVSEIEHLNVQSLYSQLEYDYETTKQELELAKLDLQNFLDLEIEDEVQVTGLYDLEKVVSGHRLDGAASVDPGAPDLEAAGEERVSADAAELKKYVDLAYGNRPELQVQAAQLAVARFKERVKWGEFMPRADITIEAGELAEAFDEVAIHPDRHKEFRAFLELKWNAGGSTIGYQFENDEKAPSVTQFLGQAGNQTNNNILTVDLFDGLEAFAQAKEAEAEKLDKVVELENAEKEVIQDVKQAYYDYQKAMIQVRSTLKRMEYREKAALYAKHRLEQNEIQIAEYLEASLNYLRERVEVHKALRDYFTAKSALNRAVGIRNYLPIEEEYGQ